MRDTALCLQLVRKVSETHTNKLFYQIAVHFPNLVRLRSHQQRTVPQTTLFKWTRVRFGRQRPHHTNEPNSDINRTRVRTKSASVKAPLVSHSQTFRLMAEGLEFMAAFISQGSPMSLFDRHVKQPITVCFVQRHISGHGNVATISDRCVKLADVL